jgi:hypothetical protein
MRFHRTPTPVLALGGAAWLPLARSLEAATGAPIAPDAAGFFAQVTGLSSEVE